MVGVLLCVSMLYLYLQHRGEGFGIFSNPSDVKRSGENWWVVILILDVNHHFGCVS